MSDTKLMPCPFCGGEARLIGERQWFWVRCDKCILEMHPFSKKEEAIKAWNTRKPMKRIVEQITEAHLELEEDENSQDYYEGLEHMAIKAIEIVQKVGAE